MPRSHWQWSTSMLTTPATPKVMLPLCRACSVASVVAPNALFDEVFPTLRIVTQAATIGETGGSYASYSLYKVEYQ